MGLKDIIGYIKSKLSSVFKSKEAETSDTYFRLRHIFGHCDRKNNCTSVTNSFFDVFTFPENMDYEDALKVLSFLTDKVTSDFNVRHHNLENIKLTNALLEQFHFKKADFPVHKDNIVDLCIETGNAPHCEKNNMYFSESEWYKEYIKENEIKEIYSNLGLEIDLTKFDKEIAQIAKGPKYQSVVVNPYNKSQTM